MTTSVPVRSEKDDWTSNPSSLQGSEWTEWSRTNENPSAYAAFNDTDAGVGAADSSESETNASVGTAPSPPLAQRAGELLRVVEAAAVGWFALSEAVARTTIPHLSESIAAWNDLLVSIGELLHQPEKAPLIKLRRLLAEERISEARELSRRLLEMTSDPLVEHYARVLERAKVVESSSTDHERIDKNHAWLANKTNAQQYRGKWIALDNGEVVASAETPSELLEEVGKDSGYLITQIF